MRLIYSVVRKLAEVFFGGRPIGFVRILRANEIAKHNTNDAGAFRSPNYSTNFQFVSMKRAEAL